MKSAKQVILKTEDGYSVQGGKLTWDLDALLNAAPSDLVTLVSTENLNEPNEPREYFLHSSQGVPGNTDSNIRRYHGWRGTTNNHYCEAHGQRRVIAITDESMAYGEIYVRISADLHPDWD